MKELPCPTPSPVYVEKTGLAIKVVLFLLEVVGIHGFVGCCGGTLLILGMLRLCFGGVLFCRKSKAQQYYDDMREAGAEMKG